ncbi:glycosyltransferase family 4 protein [Turneriella parva]|uniref:Glycosyl transferase group 1 n=1 Tax=Turneriella parva (strain ATCC BAA-1111 / DSM 21527 / NCTC 11395 / H) TaxID=869212 RepID=I4B708_TURPD|nr:glycosyltransferase family 4 protein [Turneriella parva]AFM13065.1 glycosyl transferase group 1 [Turneriella parva DSM 21527]
MHALDYTIENSSAARIAFLGDYVPRQCGIATFTHDLSEAIADESAQSEVFICAVNDRAGGYHYSDRVRIEIEEKDLRSYRSAADFLNFSAVDILCVQHEFGIYGGTAGSHLLGLLDEVRMPVITTLHTILREPDAGQRRVMREILDRSDRVVAMAHKGSEILTEIYGVAANKISQIPHGIPDLPFDASSHYKAQFGFAGKKVLFTFGLLSPAKGIEYAIRALPQIIAAHPQVVYVVLGATHPNLLASEGETYRLSLERLAADLGVSKQVIFYNQYVSSNDLREFIGATDIYITPYISETQITSGTLAYLFGAGKAVVSTPYWHAQELLADNSGQLVPFRDASAIAIAVCRYLEDEAGLALTQARAYASGRRMVWSEVARAYLKLFRDVRSEHRVAPRHAFAEWTLDSRAEFVPPLRTDHVARMTDSTGILQHAIVALPNFAEGYCTDDNARAFILTCMLVELGDDAMRISQEKLATNYLAYLWYALDGDRFRNFMSYERIWRDSAGSEDSHARAVWAAGTGVARSQNISHRTLCVMMFRRAIYITEAFTSPRAWAFALLGINEYLHRFSGDSAIQAIRARLTQKLLQRYRDTATEGWQWFENVVSYDNARISQALIISGQQNSDSEALSVGLESLDWLESVQKSPNGCFRPVGSNGFYVKGETKAIYDQQPLEAGAMIAACLSAYRATHDIHRIQTARRTFEWFMGRNDLGVSLYDATTGGCRDGLHADRLNENQGAESTLAFHLARADLDLIEHEFSTRVSLL